MKIEGYIQTVIINKNVCFFSKTKDKFVSSVDKIYLGDLCADKFSAEKSVDLNNYPIVEKYNGVVKVTISVEF